jgi:hypothetical protein
MLKYGQSFQETLHHRRSLTAEDSFAEQQVHLA